MADAMDGRLTAGFHDFEADNVWRWTNDDAVIPNELFQPFDGPFNVELTVAGMTNYAIGDREAA